MGEEWRRVGGTLSRVVLDAKWAEVGEEDGVKKDEERYVVVVCRDLKDVD